MAKKTKLSSHPFKDDEELSRFQSNQGLKVTGKYDNATRSRYNSMKTKYKTHSEIMNLKVNSDKSRTINVDGNKNIDKARQSVANLKAKETSDSLRKEMRNKQTRTSSDNTKNTNNKKEIATQAKVKQGDQRRKLKEENETKATYNKAKQNYEDAKVKLEEINGINGINPFEQVFSPDWSGNFGYDFNASDDLNYINQIRSFAESAGVPLLLSDEEILANRTKQPSNRTIQLSNVDPNNLGSFSENNWFDYILNAGKGYRQLLYQLSTPGMIENSYNTISDIYNGWDSERNIKRNLGNAIISTATHAIRPFIIDLNLYSSPVMPLIGKKSGYTGDINDPMNASQARISSDFAYDIASNLNRYFDVAIANAVRNGDQEAVNRLNTAKSEYNKSGNLIDFLKSKEGNTFVIGGNFRSYKDNMDTSTTMPSKYANFDAPGYVDWATETPLGNNETTFGNAMFRFTLNPQTGNIDVITSDGYDFNSHGSTSENSNIKRLRSTAGEDNSLSENSKHLNMRLHLYPITPELLLSRDRAAYRKAISNGMSDDEFYGTYDSTLERSYKDHILSALVNLWSGGEK